MATKDFDITENKDIDNEQKETQTVQTEQLSTEASKIKNAHATGDGSYGRSDDSISEKGEDDQADDIGNNY